MEPALVPIQHDVDDADLRSSSHLVHSVLRMVLAVRYRKYLVATVMLSACLLGGLYFATAPRLYSSQAALLISKTGRDQLDTSIANTDVAQLSVMPTFENMILSAKVLEGAVKNLAPGDRIDFLAAPPDQWTARLQQNCTAKAIRNTNILEISYTSQDPQVAANVVRAIVQSFLEFTDEMHKGTAGEISRVLTKERDEVAAKLASKQEELLECRRRFADMGFRADGKALHPMVQRAVYFNDALIAAQKNRVEQEALLGVVQAAIDNHQDVGQYVMAVGDAVGREMLLNGLGLGGRDAQTQTSLEQSLLNDRAQLQTALQNLGPRHPEVIALTEKIRQTEYFLSTSQQRIAQRMSELNQAQLGAWLVQMVRQKVEESRNKEAVLQAYFEQARAEAIDISGQLAQIEMLERDLKRLGEMNDVLLNQIASLDVKQNGADIRVAVLDEPKVMLGPVSPRLKRIVFLALLCGFGASLGLVSLLDALDDRFRSVEEMQSRLGLPLMAAVHRLEPSAASGLAALVSSSAPTSVESESFRTLRTALTLTHPDARQIVVTSAEPGDGKTTVLANLAVCCAQADKRTLLIDADMRRPGLTNLMNMRGPRGLSEILRGEDDVSRLAEEYVQSSGMPGLDILPAGPRPTNPGELLGGPRLSQLLAWAETRYDMILVDCPPSLATTDAMIVGRLVDGMLLVVQPMKNRRHLVVRVVDRLTQMKMPLMGLVVNHAVAGNADGYFGYHGYGYGDGYGYGYGQDDADAGDESSTADDELDYSFDGQDAAFRRDDRDDSAGPLVVPRRAA
jgi:succinoglycan biosynthesis transport protein ExoP